MPTRPELLDQPEEVRSGEGLDLEPLRTFLEAHGIACQELEVRQFRRGYSNLTYLLRCGGAEYVLRRPPFGANIKGGHDMGREFRILSGLVRVFPKVPRPIAFSEDPAVLGAPFYVMERVTGMVLRSAPPPGVDLSPPRMAALCASAIGTLAEIHAVDYRAAGLGDLGKPEGYVGRQVDGWIRRYGQAKTDPFPEMDQVAAWLQERKPAESGAALIHNDFKYDNLVLDCEDLARVRAVLDWEMATLGDPWMDLGSTLGYWVEAEDPEEWRDRAFGLTTLPGNADREGVIQLYERATGRTVEHPVFYFVYGLYKIAVIVQQIHARYRAGHTRDERFAALIFLVRAAARLALRAIECGRISRLG